MTDSGFFLAHVLNKKSVMGVYFSYYQQISLTQ